MTGNKEGRGFVSGDAVEELHWPRGGWAQWSYTCRRVP